MWPPWFSANRLFSASCCSSYTISVAGLLYYTSYQYTASFCYKLLIHFAVWILNIGYAINTRISRARNEARSVERNRHQLFEVSSSRMEEPRDNVCYSVARSDYQRCSVRKIKLRLRVTNPSSWIAFDDNGASEIWSMLLRSNTQV